MEARMQELSEIKKALHEIDKIPDEDWKSVLNDRKIKELEL